MAAKICTKCFQAKPRSEFYKFVRSKDGYAYWCKECMDRLRNQNPAKRFEQRRASDFQRKYNLTLAEWERLFIQQNGLCAICGNWLKLASAGAGTGNGTAHVDHNHQTGGVRGLLCSNCNAGVGQFKDSPEILNLAKQYLAGKDAS